ncbi:PEBP-like protein [Rhizodiscina lignyota]|uniref:PEBP-like protein n=1 Tax=Rhizodiscina lignyota TaxID=1504668 RepID=A0A9P4IIE6_9PEZI|nr:PEBP-like protein [Rhizodiscina lignyota]
MASNILNFLCQILLLIQVTSSFPTEQQVFEGDGSIHADNILKVRAELQKAEIIPTVINDFIPSMTLNIAWPWKDSSHYNITSELGNTIKPSRLQRSPNVLVDDDPTSTSLTKGLTFVLTLTDPDAPSRDDPKWSEMCHWIVAARGPKDVTEVVEYKPPGPPPKTGKHRYVFLAWLPANRTTEGLHLVKPKDRQHWGYDPDVDGFAGRVGVRKWASEMGLMPIAANFIYAQNKEQ